MDSNRTTFLICGDFIPPPNGTFFLSNDLQNILRDKDFSIANLECPLTSSTKPITKIGVNIKRPLSAVVHVKDCFFDAVALSNNHILDYGDKGVIDTIQTCKQNGILTLGAGVNVTDAKNPLRLTIKNKRFSFLNFSETEFNAATDTSAGANSFQLIDVYNQITEEKKHNDFVIVIYHGGIEYHHLPTERIVNEFKFLIDVGADVVVSHHTHRYSGVIYVKGKPIVFGLGNFIAPTTTIPNDNWLVGLIVKVVFEQKNIKLQLIPTRMGLDFSSASVLTGVELDSVLNRIKELSETIGNEEGLRYYWKLQAKKNEAIIINTLKSDSRFEYRLRKYFTFQFWNKLSKYRLMTTLNIMRCSSQREKFIKTLEGLYQNLIN